MIDSVVDPRPSFRVKWRVHSSFCTWPDGRKWKSSINASTGGAILGEVTPPISEDMAPSPAFTLWRLETCGGRLLLGIRRRLRIFVRRRCASPTSTARFLPQEERGCRLHQEDHPEEPLVVYGDGTQQRDYLYVGDWCAASKRRYAGTPGAYQLGSGKPTSLRTLIGDTGKRCPAAISRSVTKPGAAARFIRPGVISAKRPGNSAIVRPLTSAAGVQRPGPGT